MSKIKGFFLGFFLTLAIIIPIYLLFAALGLRSSALPIDGAKANVPMAKPVSEDAKTVLIISGKDNAETFVLLRLDALTNRICTVVLPENTVLLLDGQPITLGKAAATCGPAQAVECIAATLDITINDYIMASPKTLAEMASPLGSANVRLANYLSSEALGQLKLLVPGVETLVLSPTKLLEILSSGLIPDEQLAAIRGDGYLAFLRAGAHMLAEVFPSAMRKYSKELSTSITATDIYDYERVLKFLQKQEPEFKTGVLPGEINNGRFELAPTAPDTAKEYLYSSNLTE
ncbi:MAG: hypothetical protein RSA78_03085 [Oscillospiraceae bacterium]